MLNLAAQMDASGRSGDAAFLLSALTKDADAEIRAEARFRLAALKRRAGDLATATRLYREILAERPAALPVRLELAEVLALQGEEDAARRELRRARSVGLPPDVARLVDQFATALRSERRLGASMEIGIAPDSNINRATRDRTVEIGTIPFDLSEDARAQSGLGMNLSGQAFWRPRLNDTASMLFSLSGNGNIYGREEFTDIAFSFSGGPELILGQLRWRPALITGQRWYGGNAYSTSNGLTMNFLRPVGRQSQVEIDLTTIDARYQRNPLLNGMQYAFTGRFEHAFSPRLYGRIMARAERQAAQDPAYATTTLGGEWLLSRQTGKQVIYARLGFSRTLADAAFSFIGAKRNDRLIDAEVGLLLRRWQWAGMSPVVRLGRTTNSSPVFFYRFQRWRAELALSREF